jgi:hypothetical protein
MVALKMILNKINLWFLENKIMKKLKKSKKT